MRSLPRTTIAILLVSLLALVAGGIWFYFVQEREILEQAEREISAIGQLKARQVAEWRDALLDEGAEVVERPILLAELTRYIADSQNGDRQRLLAELTALQRHDQFSDVLLVDADGNVLLSASGAEPTIADHALAAIETALTTREPALIDLHRGEQEVDPHLTVVAPLIPPESERGSAPGALLLFVNADDYLYPLIQSWPTPSTTAESLLVRREGDEVVFLNDLRHAAAPALSLRVPISQTTLPAARAITGATGVVTGQDYRGVDVVAALEPVPGSPWYLIAKIDRGEVLADWRARALGISAFVAVLATILGALVLLGRQRNEKDRYRLLYQAEAQARASDQRFRAMISALPDLFFRLDADGRFLDNHTGDPSLLIAPPAEFIGKTLSEVLPARLVEPAYAAIRQVLDTGEAYVSEYELDTDGRSRWFEQRVVKATDNEVFAIARDISDRKRNALLIETRLHLLEYATSHNLGELLQESLDRVCALTDSPIGFYHFVEADQTTLSLQAWSTRTLQEFCRAEGKGLHYALDLAGVWADCVRRREPIIHNDFAAVSNQRGMPDGHAKVTRELVVPIFRQEQVVAILGVGNKPAAYKQQDLEVVTYLADVAWEITQRKRIEESLQQEQEQLATLTDNLPGIAARVDRDLRYLYASRGHEQLYGVAPHRILGRTMAEILGGERYAEVAPYAARALSGEQVSWEKSVQTASGKPAWYWTTYIPDRRPDDAVEGFFILEIDSTAQHQAEEDYHTLFQSMTDGFALHEIILDAGGVPVDYRFLAVNPAFERMTGLAAAQIIGKTVHQVMPNTEPIWIERYGQVALTGEPVDFESYAQELRRHYAVSAFRAAPGQFACFFSDITHRKNAEAERARLHEQLVQAQKLETVGRLAGGVAHDFNNMLAAILMRAELGLMQVEEGAPMQRHLSEIQRTAQRSADLTRQLLGFARKQTIAPKVFDINTMVEGLSTMLQRLIGENIELVWRPQPALWPVKLDPSQVDQLLVNLVVNARDAIVGAGRITIETANLSLDERYHTQWPDSQPGDYVMLAVSDNGGGMDAETLSHIFEPFFTTKQAGKGTGLGLATVYGIVQQNRGFIQVHSEPQLGTTFKILLPRTLDGVTELPPLPSGTLPPGDGYSVLLAEDEDVVLSMGVEILEGLGYTVLAADSPAAALRLAGEHDGHIDLLITDVIMPGMNGRELAERMQALRPAIKILYISGYPADFISDRAVLADGVHFLQKPFSLRSLALQAHAALEDPGYVTAAPAQEIV